MLFFKTQYVSQRHMLIMIVTDCLISLTSYLYIGQPSKHLQIPVCLRESPISTHTMTWWQKWKSILWWHVNIWNCTMRLSNMKRKQWQYRGKICNKHPHIRAKIHSFLNVHTFVITFSYSTELWTFSVLKCSLFFLKCLKICKVYIYFLKLLI